MIRYGLPCEYHHSLDFEWPYENHEKCILFNCYHEDNHFLEFSNFKKMMVWYLVWLSEIQFYNFTPTVQCNVFHRYICHICESVTFCISGLTWRGGCWWVLWSDLKRYNWAGHRPIYWTCKYLFNLKVIYWAWKTPKSQMFWWKPLHLLRANCIKVPG